MLDEDSPDVETGVFALGAVCNFGRVYLMRVSGQNMTAALRSTVFASIMRQVGCADCD